MTEEQRISATNISAKCPCGEALVRCDFHDRDDPVPCEEILCTGCLDEVSECTCGEPRDAEED